MINWQQSGESSYYAYIKSLNISAAHVKSLWLRGMKSPTGRARLCLHDNPSSPLHIMLIYHDERTIVPIHRHLPFGEYILIRKGSLEVVLYDNNLNDESAICLGSTSKEDFFCFIPPNVWHTLRFKKPTIFLEVSQGPLDVKTTEFTARA